MAKRRKKKPAPAKKPKKKLYRNTKPLPPIPDLKLESRKTDKNLANTIYVIYVSLVDIEKFKPHALSIDENRYGENYIYLFENLKNGLMGYVGRDKTGALMYLAIDQSRFKWAVAEGFITNTEDHKEREFVFSQIGAFRKLAGLTDFIKFIAGKPGFIFDGDYILSSTGDNQ